MEIVLNRHWHVIILYCLFLFAPVFAQNSDTRSPEYSAVQQKLASGWNTWDTNSLTSHVLLPAGVAINLAFKETEISSDHDLNQIVSGENDQNVLVRPGIRSWDGSYTELEFEWRDLHVRVQSAVLEGDLYLLVTPISQPVKPSYVIAQAGMLWGRSGSVVAKPGWFQVVLPDTLIPVYPSQEPEKFVNYPVLTPYLALSLENSVGFVTGSLKTIREIETVIEAQRRNYTTGVQKYGDLAEVWQVVQSVVAWNTIYDPQKNRVMTTGERSKNIQAGGWTLQDEIPFYAAMMAGLDNKELAYANIREIINEHTDKGFIPAIVQANGYRTLDRSQLPLAGTTVLMLYNKYQEKWLAEELFGSMLNWNRWWDIYRNFDGLLCPGSNPYQGKWHDPVQGNARAAARETGLAALTEYEQIPFNAKTQMLEMYDVGLNSLYIADCNALAELAAKLDKKSEERELRSRAKQYTTNLERLWDESSGVYLNLRADNGDFIPQQGATLFYSLLTDAPPESRVTSLVDNQLSNTDHFGGDFVIPTINKQDAAFVPAMPGRGAVSPPVNFWIYRGLLKFKKDDARKQLAEKSTQLLLAEWAKTGELAPRYSSGNGSTIGGKNRFHPWAGLLGLMALMEAGQL